MFQEVGMDLFQQNFYVKSRKGVMILHIQLAYYVQPSDRLRCYVVFVIRQREEREIQKI